MAFSTNGTCGGNGLSSEINVTPLIDVLLVLLIIFMVMVPVAPCGLAAVAPSSGAPASSEEAAVRPVMVEVEAGGAEVHYRVDGESLDRGELGPRLAELLGRKSTRSVLLKGDSALDFGVISEAIDAGQAAGAESVGLVTPGVEGPRSLSLR